MKTPAFNLQQCEHTYPCLHLTIGYCVCMYICPYNIMRAYNIMTPPMYCLLRDVHLIVEVYGLGWLPCSVLANTLDFACSCSLC